MSINHVTISGNLTRDPRLTVPSQEGQVARLELSVAVNDRTRNQQTGEWEDRANFFDCVLFGPRAQAIAPHMAKGQKVALEGRLRHSTWTKDDERRSAVSIVVSDIELMDAKASGPQRLAGQGVASAARPAREGGVQEGLVEPRPLTTGHADAAMGHDDHEIDP